MLECLRSVTSQTLREVEVLVVDDNSSDASRELIAQCARSDARIVPIYLTQSTGAGGARNAGVHSASGEYLLFLDVDDGFADPSALEAISQRLDAGDFDVLLFDSVNFDFERGQPCRNHSATSKTRRVLEAAPATFRLSSFPPAIWASWVPWNKAYRRSLVKEARLSFPSGYYEDSVWSLTALLSARFVGALPRPCVNRRCCRPDSYSAAPNAGHFDIFAQYGRIDAFMEGNPDLAPEPLRAEIRRKMAEFLRDMSETLGVIPPPLLGSFRSRTDELVARWQRL